MNVGRAGLWLVMSCAACGGRDVYLGDGPAEAGVLPFDAFEAPTELTGLASEDGPDDDPSLSADLGLLFFNSERDGGAGKEDIWSAERAGPGVPFAAPRNVTALNSEDRETGIALAADGLTVWFASDRPGGAGGLDVYTASRESRAAEFGTPVRVPALSSEGDDLVSAVNGTSTVLYLARRADDEADYDLFVAERSTTSLPFTAPVPLATLNGASDDSDAFERADTLVFTRDEDLVYARRADSTATFELVGPLATLNSADDDRDAWLSEDARYLVFSSNRSGAYRLYEARR